MVGALIIAFAALDLLVFNIGINLINRNTPFGLRNDK